MEKQKERIRQIQDPDILKFLGVKSGKKQEETGLLPGGSINYANADVKETEYDRNYNPGLDFFLEEDPLKAKQLYVDALDETRAQQQSKGEKWLYGVGRVLTKTGTEFAKGLGYIGGAIPALVNQDLTDMTNNWFVEAFQNLEDEAKEAMPIYVREEVENGSLARQLWSPEFWVTEGADGLGFMLSAILTGGTVAGGSKALQLSTKIASTFNKGKSVANSIDHWLISGTQTYVEAAAEAKGIVDSLKQEWSQYAQPDGTYKKLDKITGDEVTYTQEEVDSIIGNAGVETMALNALFLLPGNSLQAKYIFGKPTGTTGLLSKIDTSTPESMKKALTKITPWKSGSKNAIVEGVKGASAEGFQELSQFAIENYESKKAKGLTNKDLLEGLLEGYEEGLTTIEGQKSIILGAVLGLGPGAVGAYKNTTSELKNVQGLTELMSNSSQSFKNDLTSIYKKDEEGNIQTNSQGKPIIDKIKLTEVYDSVKQDMIYSKLYEEAKQNKDYAGARHALTEITLKNLYPYLEVNGGLDLWSQHVEDTVKIVENDALDLGFETKQDYANFLKDIGIQAKEQHKKIKDLGPSFYGISTKSLKGIENINEKLQQFIGNIEYNAVRLGVIDNNLRKTLSVVKQGISEIESKVSIPEGKTMEEALKEDKVLSIAHNMLEQKEESLTKSLSEIGNYYESLFDKKKQRENFEKFVKAKEKIEEAVKEDEAKQTEDEKFINTFYSKLADKGYNVSKTEDGVVNDFGQNNVTLVDDNGQVYRIEKTFDKKTESSKFMIRNLETNKSVPLNVDNLKKLGLTEDSNILTKDEFRQWVKANRILNRNTNRLLAVSKLIREHNKTKKDFGNELKKLNDELAVYQEELAVWQNAKDYTAEDVLEEIIRIEYQIEEVTDKIAELNQKKEHLQETITTLEQLKNELTTIIKTQNLVEFSFNQKFKEIERKLDEGEFELDRKILEESIDITQEWIDELNGIKDSLELTKQELLDAIVAINEIELLFDGNLNSKSLAQKLRTNYPTIMVGEQEIGNISKTQLRKILADKTLRNQLLAEQKDNKRSLMSSYNINASELRDIKNQIKDLRRNLDKFRKNRRLLIKYEHLELNLRTLEKRNEILAIKELEANISDNQRKDRKSSPKEQTDKTSVMQNTQKKVSPYTSITGVYKVGEKKDGLPVKADNWKQAARWSKVMNKIPLSEVDNYSVRFVNNEQLESLGVTPPVEDTDAMYVVLYDKNSGEVFTDEEGPIFTGIAYPDTYFNEKYVSIDVERIYENKLSKVSEEKPQVFNNVKYTDAKEMLDAIVDKIKEDYSKWRADKLDKLNKGEELYSDVLDISPGVAQYTSEKNAPKEVLDIKQVRIYRTPQLLKENGAPIEVEVGMPYAELTNGHTQRIFNKRIGELEDSEIYMNRILSFIALAKQMDNNNFRQEFKFKGTKSTIPLFGSNKKVGILDLYLNWGKTADNKYSVAIYPKVKGDPKSPLELIFFHKGKKEAILLDNIFDKNGKVKKINDPELRTFRDFLETKYANISFEKLGEKMPNGFWMPTGVTNGNEITFKKHDSYSDYVLDNITYTNVQKYNEETDDIPNYINNYITFDDNTKPQLPKVQKAKQAEEKPTESVKAIDTQNQLPSDDSFTPVSQMWEDYDADTSEDSILNNPDIASKMIAKKVATEQKEEVKCKTDKKKNRFPNKKKSSSKKPEA